jgi:hypothetical protein
VVADFEKVGAAGATMGRGVAAGATVAESAMGSLIKTMAPLLAAFSAVQAATTALKFDNMQQQSTLAFETMLGSADAAKKMVGDLVQFAANTPFEMPGLTKSTQQLIAMGFAGKDALPMSPRRR